MNCSSFERWLDAGMPEVGSRTVLAHAAGCRVCAPALAEARAVEAVLREEDHGRATSTGLLAKDRAFASPGFVDAVMARVDAEAARTRRTEMGTGPEPLWRGTLLPVWLRLFADPLSAVSVTLAIVVGAIATLEPGWVAAGAAAIVAFAHKAGEGVAAWPVLSRPSPTALAAAAAIAPLLALVAVGAYRSFERALILLAGGRRR